MNELMYKIPCPNCGVTLKATNALVGKRTKCPKCETPFNVVKGKRNLSMADTDKIEPLFEQETKKTSRRE